MQCLTEKECRKRIESRGMEYAPHPRTPWDRQIEQPATPAERARLGEKIAPLLAEGSILVVVSDWAFYQPEEMARLEVLRHRAGETRRLIDAPGHLFKRSEQAELAPLLALLLGFLSRWSFYVYALSPKATLYFWEGDFLDVWSRAGLANEIQQLAAPVKKRPAR